MLINDYDWWNHLNLLNLRYPYLSIVKRGIGLAAIIYPVFLHSSSFSWVSVSTGRKFCSAESSKFMEMRDSVQSGAGASSEVNTCFSPQVTTIGTMVLQPQLAKILYYSNLIVLCCIIELVGWWGVPGRYNLFLMSYVLWCRKIWWWVFSATAIDTKCDGFLHR